MSAVAQTEIAFSVSESNSGSQPCPTGQARNNIGVCVQLSEVSTCPPGQEKDENNICVPINGISARGKFTKLRRPSSVNAATRFNVECQFDNIGSRTGMFAIHVKIPQFDGLDALTSFHRVDRNTTGIISVILMSPVMPNDGIVDVTGSLELIRAISTNTDQNNIIADDFIQLAFKVVKATGVTV